MCLLKLQASNNIDRRITLVSDYAINHAKPFTLVHKQMPWK